MLRKINILTLALISLASPALAATYDIDPSHTSINFSVKHMVVSNVRGTFDEFSGWFDLDGKQNLANAQATIKAASINTRDEKRDKHLKSPDFFDADKYPEITFTTKKIMEHDGKLHVVGDLTIKDVTKQVLLTGEMAGPIVDPWKNTRCGFHAEGKINRKEFNIDFHKVLDTGGLVVGDEVTITLEVEGVARKTSAN